MSNPPQPPMWGAPRPPRKMNPKAKGVAIACACFLSIFILLAIIGSFLGSPKKTVSSTEPLKTTPGAVTTTASRAPASSPARQTPRATPSSAPVTPAAPRPSAKPAPPAPPRMQLVFTGGLKGQVSQALKVLPTKTGAHYDYNTPPSATQCIFPADDGAWSAQMAFRLKEQTWQVSIGAGGFGLPKPGSHPGLPETLVGGASDDPNAVSLMVSSTASPDGQTGGVDETGYYTPQDHNDGAGTVVINPGLTSGTLDVWLTPSYPDPLVFHITGRWSCV